MKKIIYLLLIFIGDESLAQGKAEIFTKPLQEFTQKYLQIISSAKSADSFLKVLGVEDKNELKTFEFTSIQEIVYFDSNQKNNKLEKVKTVGEYNKIKKNEMSKEFYVFYGNKKGEIIRFYVYEDNKKNFKLSSLMGSIIAYGEYLEHSCYDGTLMKGAIFNNPLANELLGGLPVYIEKFIYRNKEGRNEVYYELGNGLWAEEANLLEFAENKNTKLIPLTKESILLR